MPKDTRRNKQQKGLNLEYCEFDLSKIQDTKGGFFIPKAIEEATLDSTTVLPAPAKVAQFESTRALDEDLKCSHCPSIDLDWKLCDYYNVLVCKKCRTERPDEYSLLTKTECKQDYLLTDEELMDKSEMPHQIKKNPHKSTYSNMLLYLRKQVEAFAWKKWGSPEGLDAEFAKRDAVTAARKEKALKKKAVELRRKTRTSLWDATQLNLKKGGGTLAKGDHEHDFGEAEKVNEELMQQVCKICGIKQVFEEFSF